MIGNNVNVMVREEKHEKKKMARAFRIDIPYLSFARKKRLLFLLRSTASGNRQPKRLYTSSQNQEGALEQHSVIG